MTKVQKQYLVFGAFLALLALVVVGLGKTLFSLLVATVLAFLTYPLVVFVEKKGLGRTWSVLLSFFVITFFVLLFWVLVAPFLLVELKSFIAEFPNYLRVILALIKERAAEFGLSVNVDEQTVSHFFIDALSNFSDQLLTKGTAVVENLFKNILTAFLIVLNLSLIPVFYFYFILDFENILLKLKSYIPSEHGDFFQRYFGLIKDVLSGYFRGQFIVVAFLASSYSLGLSLIGVKFGAIIGVVAGLLSFIPYVGAGFALFASLVSILATQAGFVTLGLFFVLFGIVQGIEGLFVTPRFVGNKVGLNPLTTMLALIIGGNVYGILGMLLAVPVAALMKHILSDLAVYAESNN